MIILKYLIGFVIGYITSTIISIVLTVIRFGIPTCKGCIAENLNIPDEEKKDDTLIMILGLKSLLKRYRFSLLIWIPIILVITLICLKWLDTVFIGYIIAIILHLPSLIRKTGYNQNNLDDFAHALKSNIESVSHNRYTMK